MEKLIVLKWFAVTLCSKIEKYITVLFMLIILFITSPFISKLKFDKLSKYIVSCINFK